MSRRRQTFSGVGVHGVQRRDSDTQGEWFVHGDAMSSGFTPVEPSSSAAPHRTSCSSCSSGFQLGTSRSSVGQVGATVRWRRRTGPAGQLVHPLAQVALAVRSTTTAGEFARLQHRDCHLSARVQKTSIRGDQRRLAVLHALFCFGGCDRRNGQH